MKKEHNFNGAIIALMTMLWLMTSSKIYADEYIFADSDSRYLDSSEIQYMTKQELCYARNEIYAKHGRTFKSRELMDYFISTSWYDGYIDPDHFDNDSLNQYEKENVKLLYDTEHFPDSEGYQLDQPGNDYESVAAAFWENDSDTDDSDVYIESDTYNEYEYEYTDYITPTGKFASQEHYYASDSDPINEDRVRQDVLAHVAEYYRDYNFDRVEVTSVNGIYPNENDGKTQVFCIVHGESAICTFGIGYVFYYYEHDYGWSLGEFYSSDAHCEPIASDVTEEQVMEDLREDFSKGTFLTNFNEYSNFSLLERDTRCEQLKEYITLKCDYYDSVCGNNDDTTITLLYYFFPREGHWRYMEVTSIDTKCPKKKKISFGNKEPYWYFDDSMWP